MAKMEKRYNKKKIYFTMTSNGKNRKRYNQQKNRKKVQIEKKSEKGTTREKKSKKRDNQKKNCFTKASIDGVVPA